MLCAVHKFYSPINLHYSQTRPLPRDFSVLVLLPYKFTLLSNDSCRSDRRRRVLLPYKFTLLSNHFTQIRTQHQVLLPYKFTLLSNLNYKLYKIFYVLLPYKFTLLSNQLRHAGLGPWGFYYPINLHYSQT